jgi:hypothetical protein
MLRQAVLVYRYHGQRRTPSTSPASPEGHPCGDLAPDPHRQRRGLRASVQHPDNYLFVTAASVTSSCVLQLRVDALNLGETETE